MPLHERFNQLFILTLHYMTLLPAREVQPVIYPHITLHALTPCTRGSTSYLPSHYIACPYSLHERFNQLFTLTLHCMPLLPAREVQPVIYPHITLHALTPCMRGSTSYLSSHYITCPYSLHERFNQLFTLTLHYMPLLPAREVQPGIYPHLMSLSLPCSWSWSLGSLLLLPHYLHTERHISY